MPYVNNDGIRIYFEITGSGAPLILQHGLSDSIAGWRESGLVERLQDRHLMIMIDARGHGRSENPHYSAAYELKQRVGDVLAVLGAHPEQRCGRAPGIGRTGPARRCCRPGRLHAPLPAAFWQCRPGLCAYRTLCA